MGYAKDITDMPNIASEIARFDLTGSFSSEATKSECYKNAKLSEMNSKLGLFRD